MREQHRPVVYLGPGDFYFGEGDQLISTVLGSCVAVTLWHPARKIGGMCHIVLPAEFNTGKDKKKNELNGRYADDAMKMFEREAECSGTRLSNYDARIYGGSNSRINNREYSVGARNLVAVRQLLADMQIPVKSSHTGNSGSRRIIMDLKSGDVMLRHLARQEQLD